MLTLRRKSFVKDDHFQIYSGEVRIGAVYRNSEDAEERQWAWFLDGVENGPGYLNGFARTLADAKAEFVASWGAWLKAAGLNEDTPTVQLDSQ
jgi:hypothetical protein